MGAGRRGQERRAQNCRSGRHAGHVGRGEKGSRAVRRRAAGRAGGRAAQRADGDETTYLRMKEACRRAGQGMAVDGGRGVERCRYFFPRCALPRKWTAALGPDGTGESMDPRRQVRPKLAGGSHARSRYLTAHGLTGLTLRASHTPAAGDGASAGQDAATRALQLPSMRMACVWLWRARCCCERMLVGPTCLANCAG